MKVILLEDVKGKGYEGDVIEVAQGYGQNFLIKKNKGLLATEENLAKLAQQKEDAKKARAAEIEEAKKIGKDLLSKTYEFAHKAKDGKLVKSISKKELIKRIEEIGGYKINAQKFTLNISKVEYIGDFEVSYEITKNVTVKLHIKIVEG